VRVMVILVTGSFKFCTICSGGVVENAGPDVDCYKEFCASDIGRATNACNKGQVRLFNVNESESLGKS
jgi:hypothetical protein